MGYDVNARRDLNGIPVNLIKDPTTLLLTEWKGEAYGKRQTAKTGGCYRSNCC